MSLDLSAYSSKISKVCDAFGVGHLYLLASNLPDDADIERLDLDFIVEFKEVAVPGTFSRHFDFKEALEAILNGPVSLFDFRAITNPTFLQVIERDKMPIYRAR